MARKKKVEEKSQEQLQKEQLERNLNRIRKDYHFIPEPTRLFNIGDNVSIGNLKDAKVEEILDNGKIYLINYTNVDHNYGNPIEMLNCRDYWMWTEVKKINDDKESLVKNTDIRIRYSQRTIKSLLTQVYHFGVDFEPKYQRDYVWELKDKSALIDSIFNNVDIGKFTFINKGVMYPNEILDGKQRLTAICEFYEDRFPYKGKYFSELSVKDQGHFTDYNISWGELEDLTEEQSIRYFLILNTSGKVMDKEHLDKVREML